MRASPSPRAKECYIRIRKTLESGFWVIRIYGLPDFKVLAVDSDSMAVIAKFDASRFEPKIES